MQTPTEPHWDTIIRPRTGWFDIDFKELWRYRDLVVLFTNTVSHKMVRCALEEAKRSNARVVRCHTSSKSALTDILEREVAAGESV